MVLKHLTPKSGWKMLYANVIKCWNTGYGAVLGRFSGVINLALLASTYLLVKGFELSFIQSIFVGVALIAVILVSGFIYLRTGFQKAEFSSNFAEQPEMMQMKRDIEEIRDLLKAKVKK